MLSALDWEELIREAQDVSHPVGPRNLIDALSGMHKDPSNAGDKQRLAIREAHQTDVAPIYMYRHSGQPITKDNRAICIDRLAWLLKELTACEQQRPDLAKLEAILRVSRAFHFETPLWERLPETFLSDHLFACIAAFVGSTRWEISSRGQNIPIWEQEKVSDFLRADKDADWPKIEALWRTVVPAFWPDEDIAEAVACLCVAHKGIQALAAAIDTFDSLLPIVNIANAMTPQQIGEVGLLIKSNRSRFGLIQSLAFNHPRDEALTQETLDNLATVFRSVQRDVAEWEKWMAALNQYPVRTKVLQPAFGRSLVGSSIEVKSAYVEAIDLSPNHGECREAVTDCFTTFAKFADLEERRQMWGIVQTRWALWNFDEKGRESSITWIAVSELDYGVIGYALENLTALERENVCMTFNEKIKRVSNTWHRDVIALNSAWYRTLSRWQIFQYAREIVDGAVNWELPKRIYLPFDPDTDRYSAMTYPTKLHPGWKR
jgi:hypothetical protein